MYLLCEPFLKQDIYESNFNEMSKVCQITGKAAMVGNNVSHSKRRTKRRFMVNLFKKRFYLQDEDRWVTLTVSAAGIRSIDKNGIEKALEVAKQKGYYK
jgi:large subunit ribosomal protein L28